MSQIQTTVPDTLYHYTSKETLIEHILPKFSLKVGSFKNTNDPRENKQSGIIFTYDGDGSSHVDNTLPLKISNSIQNLFEKIRYNEWNLICLTMDYEEQEEFIDARDRYVSEFFRVGSSRASMWAHYAAKHTGACLVLDGKELLERIKKIVKEEENLYYGPISYINGSIKDLKAHQLEFNGYKLEDIYEEDIEFHMRRHVKEFHKELFLTKYIDWQTENEFRFLINTTEVGPKFVNIEGVLKKVILGADFDRTYYPSVTAICRSKSIAVLYIDWRNRIPICYDV